eukprot:8133987-Alexandrium_andersonii.AAC.1
MQNQTAVGVRRLASDHGPSSSGWPSGLHLGIVRSRGPRFADRAKRRAPVTPPRCPHLEPGTLGVKGACSSGVVWDVLQYLWTHGPSSSLMPGSDSVVRAAPEGLQRRVCSGGSTAKVLQCFQCFKQ